MKELVTDLTNEVDSLKQKVDNTSEVTELQIKINTMEKESAKFKRMAEVRKKIIVLSRLTSMTSTN